MDLATPYLEKQTGFYPRILEPPDPDVGFIVVIPCFSEPSLHATLESLHSCRRPEKTIEIMVVLNAPENAKQEAIAENHKTRTQLKAWTDQLCGPGFRIRTMDLGTIPEKVAGPGMARKAGMDEAVYRFQKSAQAHGIICSMDADTLCDTNYFTEIEKTIQTYPGLGGGIIYFEHPITGSDFDPQIYAAITLYELHMRYFLQSMRSIGYPHAFHTLGSAFFVTVSTYIKAGGMNRRKAGEDFYFLQKCVSMASFRDITTARVIPSPRPSARVPFGTGPWVQKYLREPGIKTRTYHYEAFRDLHTFFSAVNGPETVDRWDHVFASLSPALQSFLKGEDGKQKLREIAANTASPEAFVKRFFQWFNGFKIIRYLNHVHRFFYKKPQIELQAAAFLQEVMGLAVVPDEPKALLKIYRELERKD